MPPTTASPADPALRAALGAGLEAPVGPATARLGARVAEAFGPVAVAVVHYGSYAQGAETRPESARDFFVIVDRYAEAYRRLTATLGTRYSARTASLLNRLLPPNVVAVTPEVDGRRLQAKCAVTSLRDFERACSARARDHFALGRMFQQVQVVWTRDEASRAAVTAAIREARARTFDWGRARLPTTFDTEAYCRSLLETSYAGEIRPEAGAHVTVLLGTQRDTLLAIYGPLLDHLVRSGILAREGERYRDLDPPGPLARMGERVYFARSKLRATLRWFKYVALYEDWLDYVVHKLERRGGVTIQLTSLERRLPLIFLWPRALRYIFTRRR